jgi:hypothetical protein
MLFGVLGARASPPKMVSTCHRPGQAPRHRQLAWSSIGPLGRVNHAPQLPHYKTLGYRPGYELGLGRASSRTDKGRAALAKSRP